MVDPLTVTVLIIAKRAEKTIGQTLASIYASSRQPDEVVLVVDAPDDSTLQGVGAFTVRRVVNAVGGIGAARRAGIDAAIGDVVVFVDADSVVHPRMIEAYEIAFHRHPSVLVQAGRVVDVRSKAASSDVPNSVPNGVSNGVLFEVFNESDTVGFAETMIMALRRRVIATIGNFDDAFRAGGEDLDFCLRLRAKGVKIHRNRHAVIYHLPRENLGERLRKSARDGNTLAHVFLKHGSAALQPALNAAFHTLAVSGALLLALAGRPYLAVATLLPSLLHRLYRFSLDVRRVGITARRAVTSSLVKNCFAVYVTHFAFTKELLAKLLRVS
jgi:GT2 family glycosyltransferase